MVAATPPRRSVPQESAGDYSYLQAPGLPVGRRTPRGWNAIWQIPIGSCGRPDGADEGGGGIDSLDQILPARLGWLTRGNRRTQARTRRATSDRHADAA